MTYVPVEPGSNFIETLEDLHAAFGGDVRILPAPDHEKLTFDFAGAGHRVVLHSLAEAAFVDIGGVKADGAVNIWVHGSAEGEMASHADTHNTETTSTVGAFCEVGEGDAGIVIVCRQRAWWSLARSRDQSPPDRI